MKLTQIHNGVKDTNLDLKDLDQCYGPHGELRAQGCLTYIQKLGLDTARPLILKGKSEWTRSLIQHIHGWTLKHMAGTEQVLAEIKKKFWIMNGREALCRVLRGCVKCKRLCSNTATQQMGPISEIRIPDEASYAFQYTAVNCFERSCCISSNVSSEIMSQVFSHAQSEKDRLKI